MRTAEQHKFTKLQATAGVCPPSQQSSITKENQPKGRKENKKNCTCHIYTSFLVATSRVAHYQINTHRILKKK